MMETLSMETVVAQHASVKTDFQMAWVGAWLQHVVMESIHQRRVSSVIQPQFLVAHQPASVSSASLMEKVDVLPPPVEMDSTNHYLEKNVMTTISLMVMDVAQCVSVRTLEPQMVLEAVLQPSPLL